MKELTLIEKAFFLKNISLFNDLDLDLLVTIADKMQQDIYDKNEKVFEIKQIANRLFFIARGSVNILDQSNKVIASLEKNSFFGDESIFNNNPRSYSVVCSDDSLFLTLTKTNLYNIISECPSVGIAFIELYSKFINYK